MLPLPRETFKKTERLCSRKKIEKLFEGGRSFAIFPFRVVWSDAVPDSVSASPVQVAFSVPKKSFRRAVDRNRLKRRAREAYRKKKHELYQSLNLKNKTVLLMLIYNAREEMSYDLIQNKINQVIARLIKEVENDSIE